MVHTDIIQYLSEIDTNVFLYFNGIHSPFGTISWLPLQENNLGTDVRHHPIHITKELPLESRSVLCSRYCTYHHLRRPDVQQYHPSGRGTPAPFQSGKSHCRYGIYRQQLSWRELRFPVVSCSQSFGLAMYVVFMFRKRWLSISLSYGPSSIVTHAYI